MSQKQSNETTGKIMAFLFNIKTILVLVLIIAVVLFFALDLDERFFHESKSTKLGFEDIGELVTQSAYVTEVNVQESSRNLFGIEIPFTQSKYIYSYDVTIKAGFDFNKIRYDINDTTITVTMPQPYISSAYVDPESFKVYHESESIFTPFTLEQNNSALQELEDNAEQNAIDNGIFDNAKSNAEDLLELFFSTQYPSDEYSIEFIYVNE